MQVRALKDGFYKGRRVRAGAVFEVAEGIKGKWFEPVGLSKPAAAKAAPSPTTFNEMNAAAAAKDTPKEAAIKKALASKAPAKADEALV